MLIYYSRCNRYTLFCLTYVKEEHPGIRKMIASSGTTILFIIKNDHLEQAAISLANKFDLTES